MAKKEKLDEPPRTPRTALVQFRVPIEVFAQLQSAAEEARRRGAVQARDNNFARILFELALGIPKQIVLAHEVTMMAYHTRRRINEELAVLIDDNLLEMLDRAIVPHVKGGGKSDLDE